MYVAIPGVVSAGSVAAASDASAAVVPGGDAVPGVVESLIGSKYAVSALRLRDLLGDLLGTNNAITASGFGCVQRCIGSRDQFIHGFQRLGPKFGDSD